MAIGYPLEGDRGRKITKKNQWSINNKKKAHHEFIIPQLLMLTMELLWLTLEYIVNAQDGVINAHHGGIRSYHRE